MRATSVAKGWWRPVAGTAGAVARTSSFCHIGLRSEGRSSEQVGVVGTPQGASCPPRSHSQTMPASMSAAASVMPLSQSSLRRVEKA